MGEDTDLTLRHSIDPPPPPEEEEDMLASLAPLGLNTNMQAHIHARTRLDHFVVTKRHPVTTHTAPHL